MGVRPANPQSDLVVDEREDDVVEPEVGETVAVVEGEGGGGTTYEGTAADVGGIVAGVEVSEDGGCKWDRANCNHQDGTCDTWTYVKGSYRGTPERCGWGEGRRRCANNPPSFGGDGLADFICVRAVDDSGNLAYRTIALK